MARKLYDQLRTLTTEAPNPLSRKLDRLTPSQIVKLINSEDRKVAAAVQKVLPQVAEAAEMVAESFQQGGRLFYIGAGTSGRLGVLDASECPPTFGVGPGLVQGIIAGGRRTLVRSREGVEDDCESARREIIKKRVGPQDTVLGIAASGRTPFPLSGLKQAHKLGAKTVLLVCNELDSAPRYVDLVINPVLGPEVLAGSTRLKAGTACKMILNMITTAAMVQIGKCYRNLMVDLKATSKKLRERSIRIIVDITGTSYQSAASLLERAHGEVKTALVMQVREVSFREARKLLKQAEGRLHQVIEKT